MVLILVAVAVLLLSIAPGSYAQKVTFGFPTGCEGQTQEKCFCVSLRGAVRAPGRYELHRQLSLIELLAHAGGLADHAGSIIRITHSPQRKCTELLASETFVYTGNSEVYSWGDIRRGNKCRDPDLQAGDIVDVSEAERLYVVGNVVAPQAIYLRESVSLTQAIAMVGGVLPGSRTDKIRIIRQTAVSSVKEQITVDLKKVWKHRASDLVLQPNDIVEVPTKHGHGTRLPSGSLVVQSPLPTRVIY